MRLYKDFHFDYCYLIIGIASPFGYYNLDIDYCHFVW
jgi:hypothetical protein